jgi:hypothetical protein
MTMQVKVNIISKPKKGQKNDWPGDYERLFKNQGTFLGRHDAGKVVLIFEASSSTDAHNVNGLVQAEG